MSNYNFPEGNNRFSLLNRIYDAGKGEKFNDLTNNQLKPKEYRAFLTHDDLSDVLVHLDKNNFQPKNTSKAEKFMKENQKHFEDQNFKTKKTQPNLSKVEEFEYTIDKNDLINHKKIDIRTRGEDSNIEDESRFFNPERNEKKVQELASITGYKTISPLPPSRGRRDNSYNPMIDRFKATSGNETGFGKSNIKSGVSIYNNPMEPKLFKPTTTIIDLDDTKYARENTNKENIAVTTKLHINYNTNIPMNLNKNETEIFEDDKNLMTINNILTQDNGVKKETEERDQDQYMDNINKFIREAFEGKDYRINFVYYLPSNKENFYELRQATYSKICKEHVYYTLSAKGLTVYNDKIPKEFIKLSEWIIERQGYNKISQIDFFKNFKIWRILKIWRKNIFKQKKIAYQNELSNTLLFNNDQYIDKICRHKAYCNRLIHLNLIDLRVGMESNTYDMFITKQTICRNKLSKEIQDVHRYCESIFIEGTKKIFHDVQKKINLQNNESNYNNDEINKKKNKKFNNYNRKKDKKDEKEDTDKNEENLQINDDNIVGFENYPYKCKMLIKTECKNFIKLAFLFDYILLDVLRYMYIFSMNDILKKFEEYNSVDIPTRIRENILDKRNEYIKPPQPKTHRNIPYFQIKCNLASKKIEKLDRKIKTVKPFYPKVSYDDEFDPTAHLILEDENAEKEKEAKQAVFVDPSELAKLEDIEEDINVEVIERPHYYFTSYEPDQDTLTKAIIEQIEESMEVLKIKGWKGHPKFKKYLEYLEDWDDRFSGWDNDTAPGLDPQIILLENHFFEQRDELIRNRVKLGYERCDKFLQMLNPYLQLHWKQASIKKELFLEENLKEADEMLRLLFYYIEKNVKTLQKFVPFDEELGLIKITFEDHLRKDLVTHQHKIINYLKPLMPNLLKERLLRIEKWFSHMQISAQGTVNSEILYLEKTKAKEILDAEFFNYERKLNIIDSAATLLKSKMFNIPNEDIKAISSINTMKYNLKLMWDELNESLQKNKDKLRHQVLNLSIPELNKFTEQIEHGLADEKYINYNPSTSKLLINVYAGELDKFEDEYKKIKQNSNVYNEFLHVCGEPEFNFEKLDQIHENLLILKNLWESLKNFDSDSDEWKRKRFSDINTTEILEKIDHYFMIAKKAQTQYGDNGSAIRVLLTDVEKFKETMNVVDDLNSESLTGADWDKIQEIFPNLNEDDRRLENKDYNLEFLLEIEAYNYQGKIHEIALEALNSKILESKKIEIINDKKSIELDIIPYAIKPEYSIIAKFDEAIQKIEETQSKVNAALASRYVRLIKSEMQQTKNELDQSLEMIEDLKVFQKKWMYLENIINSGDMKKKMPDIGEFNKTDQDWKNYLAKINKGGKLSVIQNFAKLRDVVLKHTVKLDEIQHSIEEQLKAMRNDFERFFFISNDDLLYMLAKCVQTNPTAIEDIKPYLGKIFEDINDLKVNSTGVYSKEITHIISSAREELQIKGAKFSDKLEEWLPQLESQMISKLTEKIFIGKQDFEKFDRVGHITDTRELENYLQNTISQVVATVTHISFCEKTETALSNSSNMQSFIDRIDSDIKIYAKFVNKNFPKNVRRTISNLITHYVHYRDICTELIINEIEEITDFEWQKQLRTYLVDAAEAGSLSNNSIVRVRQLKSEIDFGYEYIGPTVRLVITPLTDRVWLTMTSALNIKLGCSLGGPAGTGKTETTKDLSKFLGIQCIVFNCSEQVDYKLIGNIFSGLCKHKQGAFACLDEFNRINVEVLSVIASQLLNIRIEIQKPVPNINSGLKRSVYILSWIDLIGKLVGVFITMNPTYSGRAELPDNLKSLFRPITMMVPDFNIIAKVKLYSEGFTNSEELAKKLTKLYELASQQLSQQDHYDFTLRAIGSVLSIAGNLKRAAKPTGNEKKEEENILIAALRDANFPKFVEDDIKLFTALITDLFPQNELVEQHLPDYESELKEIIKVDKLNENEFTLKKCLQIFDITNIRLGICLTGPAGSGKSVCLNLVEKTLTSLRSKNHPDPRFKDVKKKIINPKSITMGELYGQENEDTKTFIFGIATKKIKKALLQEAENNYRWVVLDGPIDTKWIENMNSVLDDSMTLCLSNGERIKLKPHVKIYFEVEDLSQASLATVSRLGIVHFSPVEKGWEPYFKSWMLKFLPDESLLNNELKHYLISLFDDKIKDAFENLIDMENTIFIKPIKVQCIANVCKFLEIYIRQENGFKGKDTPNLENPDTISRLKKKLVSVFALAVTWGVFGSVSNKSFHKIESFIRNKFTEIKMENSQMIMEHYYDFHKQDFVRYTEEKFHFDKDLPYFSIFVPTIDTVRYSTLLELMIRNQNHVFLSGETGVGKTAIILNVVKKLVLAEELTTIQINFSARSSSENTQRMLESKLDRKKGKKILFGKGGKQLSIIIDDVNMPEPNEFGAHPPIELLRQYLDLGGFYDRPKLFWKRIEDSSMIVAGGPPTGGRSKLSDRFNRHFTILNIPQQSKQALITIYEQILKGFLQANQFNDVVYKISLEIAIATIDVLEFASENMKPVPTNPHYLFNIRDVSKVFQGILMINNPGKNNTVDASKFVKLWIHENQRIFGDRLTNEIDYKSFHENLAAIAKNKFKVPNLNTDDLIKNQTIIFGEIHKGDSPERPYDEISDMKDLLKKLNFFLDMYNKNNKKSQLTLVFFEYAIMHIIRICRVLRQPRGNMLLVGHGGSGKQTLCKFSAYAMNSQFNTFNPIRNYKITDFRKDIKDFVAQAGAYRKPTVLLLTDNNVVSDFILEDVNNLLNTGEIANLFDQQTDWPNITSAVSDYLRSIGKADTIETVLETFIQQTRDYLHIFFCTSPVGDTFRLRVRKFPSLINCSTLNWFIKWPKEALISCCTRLYSQLTQYPENIRDSLIKMSVQAHIDIEELTQRYFDELSRRVYVTPKSFLDMNGLLFELVSKKKGDIDTTIKRLSDGIKKLNKTHSDIIKVEEELRILEPEIKKKEEEANIAQVANMKKQEEVGASQVIIQEKNANASRMKALIDVEMQRTNKQKEEINLELADTWKEVEKNVNKDFVANVRASKATHSEDRRIILEAAVYALTGTKITAATELTNQIGANKDRILRIRDEISKGLIADKTMVEFSKYIRDVIPPLFGNLPQNELLEKIASKTSSIYKTLFMWGQGTIRYWELETKLQPVRKFIEEKTKELQSIEKECIVLKEELDKLQTEAFKLNSEQDDLIKKIETLKKEIDMNNRRKINAGKLVGLLSEEGERWKHQLISLTENSQNFLGNIFISAMTVAYLGPFTGIYRRSQVSNWIQMSMRDYDLKVNKDYSLENILSDPVEIRNWNISGLPSDNVSTQNGIIFFTNPKYPLLIDPQLQGNIWLKKLFKKFHLNTYKGDAKDDAFKKQLEKISLDIMKGLPVLIEGIGEKIDSTYNNLISKSFFETGSGYNIEFNGQLIEFNPNFKIFFTTKLPNPHYPPEIYLKLNIINFTVTFEGLAEQLLGEVFKKEKREKYEERDHLIEDMGQNNTKLQEYARVILEKLADANEEAILDDEVLIETLENAKSSSDIVKLKTSENLIIERIINNIRDEYIPVATRGSILYFVIVDLGIIDPMYQFSLEYFKKIFSQSIERAPFSNDVKERVTILERKITEDIYKNIKRGIFESHKTIFSFLIAIYIKKVSGEIKDEEWNIFLKGPSAFDKSEMLENPDKNYFSDFSWDTLLYLENKNNLQNISRFISNNLSSYKTFFNNINEYEDFENMPNFENLKSSLKTNFSMLNLLKVFRPDKVLYFIKKFIAKEIGDYFIDTCPPKIDELYSESDNKTPIIFILSQGADPTNTLMDFNKKVEIGYTEDGKPIVPEYEIISLGQGQGDKAKEAIAEGRIKGKWIVLANCHLYTTWMQELSNLVQAIQEDDEEIETNEGFRLWLTSMPNKDFPVSILQNSLKLTTEPPSGVKANIKKLFDELNDEKLNSCNKKNVFPKIVFSLAVFHAVIQERKKFGPIGFNIRYDFNFADFETSMKMISVYLDEAEEDNIPWVHINSLIGEINYGGRVTDDIDRDTMNKSLDRFLNEEKFLEPDFKFSKSGLYYPVGYDSIEKYNEFIDSLPMFDEPDLFGLNENANIIYQIQESEKIINSLIAVMPKTKTKETSPNKVVLDTIENFMMKKPEPIHKSGGKHKSHDKLFDNGLQHSLTIVLNQEIEKYNKLIEKIFNSLEDLKKAIEGIIIMSNEGDEIFNSLLINRIPLSWAKICYPSHKPLSSWYDDLLERIEFIRSWFANGHPSSFWISGLFYPQGFITGVLQNHSRDTKIPVSEIEYKFAVLDKQPSEISKGPIAGVYIYGLFLEGASWDIAKSSLVDQNPGEMYYKMPVIWLETTKSPDKKSEGNDEDDGDENENENELKDILFKCPVFKTTKRTGIISASGRSDNHVISIDLPSKELKPEIWTLRGTALICQLNN